MQIKISALILLSGLWLSGCSGSSTPVAGLSPETQNLISQNLVNGQLPSPQAIAEGSLTPARNACEIFKATLPQNWLRGTLEVPEDSANPSGLKIRVFYYGKLTPGTNPTVFFNGGPTRNSHNDYVQLTQKQIDQDPENKISFIFIDQRGTGCSGIYPQDASRLAHYGSREIVNDAEAVRVKLGIQKWNAFGQSFGAFVVHRYAVMAPASLKAAFAHGNSLNADSSVRLKERVLSQVQMTDLYLKFFPQDRARFQALKDFLTAETCFTDLSQTRKICGASVLQLFASRLLGFTDQRESLHQWLEVMVPETRADNDGLSRFLAAFYFTSGSPLAATALAEQVIDHVDRNVIPASTANCEKVRDELSHQGVSLLTAYSHECLRPLEVQVKSSHPEVDALATDWLLPADFIRALKISPGFVFHLYSGQNDAYVPAASFAEEVALAAGLSNLIYVNFENSGHEGFLTESRVWQDLKDSSGSL